ncbi:MAG: RsmD family RNA methyltransferase [Bacteroides sp.]|nr:RsmD family RNA methyltransferase [Bacteroides sp.]
MRVISGIYKRRRFDIPKNFKARPTTDFAKENLFNVLIKYIDFDDQTTAADLFAGTGSISIELVSRGCTRVVAVEADKAHHAFICKIMKEVDTDRCHPIRGDVFRYIHQCTESFDLVFADPPYQLERLAQLPDLILEKGMVKPEGLLVLEHGKDHQFDTHPAFVEKRVYGSVNFSFFRIPEK